MTAVEFTPGPWLVDPNSGPGLGWPMLAKQGPVDVCPATAWSEHDANLIAAAPDLYEALEMVRDADEDCKRDGCPSIPSLPRAKIDAALAKARGEKP